MSKSMNVVKVTKLDRAIIKLSGIDRFTFLQGLITNDIYKLEKQPAIYACLLTPQGKFFADFFIYNQGDYFLLDMSSPRKDEILRKLSIYKLRSAVTFEILTDLQVVSFGEKPTIENGLFFADPRKDSLGYRAYISQEELKNIPHELDINLYDLRRIDNFVPEGDSDLIPESSFILEFGLDKLNAIDFKKGCYVGQELVARTHYRGVIRKEVVQVTSAYEITSEILYSGEKKLGIIGTKVYNKALALVRREDVNSLDEDSKIYAGENEVNLIFQGEEHD